MQVPFEIFLDAMKVEDLSTQFNQKEIDEIWTILGEVWMEDQSQPIQNAKLLSFFESRGLRVENAILYKE